MRRFLPKSRMAIFTLILLVLWVLKSIWLTPRIRLTYPFLGFIFDLLGLLLAVSVIYYSWKLFKYLRFRTLWKIRRRLILSHIFIGAIPFIVLIVIFYVSALLFYYQLSYFLISRQIGFHTSQIHAFNLSLRYSLQQMMTGASRPTTAALKAELDADAKYLLAAYPSASIILRFPDAEVNRVLTYANQDKARYTGRQVPEWVGDREFSNLIVEDSPGEASLTRLFLRSYVYSDFLPDLPFNIEVSVPFDQYLLGRLRAALGQNMLLARHSGEAGLQWYPNRDLFRENILESTFDSERTQAPKSLVWPMFLFPISWSTGTETSSNDFDVLMVEVSFTNLIQNLFHSESVVGERIYFVLKLIVAIFLLVEIASIVIGITLTKSITNAVYNLDRGTEFVKRGDFSQRIVVRSDDQLGALAASFNQMTEFVQHLVKERVQKERLERELEIAKEVQERLFPNHAPQMGHLDVTGICLPARTVSGDYYDFLLLGNEELGLAVGDICGKGISAALLMASLQATLRSNVMNLWTNDGRNGHKAVAEVVERLNTQIYAYTAANKFATFFYALYDDAQQTLTYCNAGHNPPLYLSGDEVVRLSAGGTVVGVFADSRYEQETIQLHSDDLLVAYTDGIVECVNEYGEEFGEHRLIQAIQENRNLPAARIKELVVEKVLSWTFAEEREDDMTLIVARIRKSARLAAR